MKDYVLTRALPDVPELDTTMTEEEALQRLEAFLAPRIAAAERGEFSALSVEEIFAQVRDEEP